MNKKFDGPSFVNPQHTSHTLSNNGSYQTPKVNLNPSNINNSNIPPKEENSKNRKGPRGWEDDDDAIIKPTIKKQSLNKNSLVNNSSGSQQNLSSNNSSKQEEHKSDNYVNYWDAENTKKIQNSTLSVEYETKLIDDILQPIGVSVKPSDNQIKEFLRRLKTLKKEIVLNILIDRLKNYENMGDSSQFKVLQVIILIFIFLEITLYCNCHCS
jgi:hypothetical protein